METIFFQLAVILGIAFIVCYLIRLLKQPLIIGYIISGIIISPFFIKFGATSEVISLLSKLGIAFLLFIVGLNLNPRVIKEIGVKSLVIGISQMIFTFILTYIVSLNLLQLDSASSFYLGIALAFSSTIIVLKLFSDQRQLDSLHGKMSIGILIIQDLAAMILLIFISTNNNSAGFQEITFKTILVGLGLILGLFFLGFFVLNRLERNIARSQELLFLFSICWCFLIAALFAFLGFSIEMGALVAGMVLSISPYSIEISSKIRPIRDFFLIIFFIILGLNLNLMNIKGILFNAIILSMIALIMKPLILMILMGLFNYTKRTNFLVSTSLGQISEFSLIILMLGVSLGKISPNLLATLTLTLIITIIGSTYMILYSKQFYAIMYKFVSLFEKKKIKNQKQELSKKNYEVILFGYNRTGFEILNSLTKLKKPYLVVDFNPDTIANLKKYRVPCIYGDVGDSELLEELNLEKVNLIISTIPDFETNELLIKHIRARNSKVVIIARAREIHETFELYKKGADYVLTPVFISGEKIARIIDDIKTDKKGYAKEKENHIKMLNEILSKSKGRLRINPHSNNH